MRELKALHGKMLLGFAHFSFLYFLVLNGAPTSTLFGTFLLPLYFIIPSDSFQFTWSAKELALDILYFWAAVKATLFLGEKLGSNVIAACIVLLVLSSSSKFWKNVEDGKNREALIYAGTFSGMSSLGYLDSSLKILLVSFFGALLLKMLNSVAGGFGGKLGTIGFFSVFISYMLLLELKC